MKSSKKLFIGIIYGLLCTNGVSLADSAPVASTVASESPKEDVLRVVSDCKSEEIQHNDTDENIMNIELLDNNKTLHAVDSTDPCHQTVYNLTYVPSPEVDKAILNFVNKSTEFMSKTLGGMLDKFNDSMNLVNDCVPPAENLSSIDFSIDKSSKENVKVDESILFPSATLKMSDELKKPVFYRTSYDKLSKIAKDYLGDSSKVSVIKSMVENADIISKMVNKDKLPDGEYLYIPQPSDDSDWVLCNVSEADSFYSLAQKYYGSWEYARLLAEFNDRTYDLGGRIYKTVVKLPKILDFSKYMVNSDDMTLARLCEKLLGSPIYDRPVASLNGLDIKAPLKIGTSVYIPTFIKYDGLLKG
jgi:hypothetical protein